MTRKAIFDAVRAAKGALSQPDVAALDAVLDKIGVARDAPPRAPASRRINTVGLAIVKEYEGCELTAYKCPAGIWTIGYGSTGAHVTPGLTITQAKAEHLLLDDLARFEQGVAKIAPISTDNQFSAMVSLAFNIGLEAFGSSTLLRLHNDGKHAEAQAQFARWNKGGGKVLPGLVRRRAAEAALYGRVD